MSKWMNSINQADDNEDPKCMESFFRCLKRMNPCLRPEKQSEHLTNFLQKFTEVSIYEDPYYGQSFLLESVVEHELVILKKQKIYDSQLPNKEKQMRQLQMFNGNPHVVSQTLIDKIFKVGFLWSKYQLYVAYDYILVDLAKQFEYRMAQNRKFTENQIVSIMKGTCKGLIHLQSTDYSSIQLAHIYLTREGSVKISHPNLFKYKSNLEIICENDEGKGIYLSPEEMICLERGDKDPILGWKSNSYVFGIVFLSLMSQQHLDDVYDYSACYIDSKKIAQLLKNCKQIYSDKLVSIVQKLVANRPQDRLTLRAVINKLSYKMQSNTEIDIQLLNQNSKPEIIEPYYSQPLQSSSKEPEHFNYLTGMVYPKVGRAGEYFNDGNYLSSKVSQGDPQDQTIIAHQRLYYENRNSQYVGQGVQIGRSKLIPSIKEKNNITRHGKGSYRNNDGQLYLGDWSKGQMHGHGKLYWNQQKIRYEGDFQQGKFNGRGVQYNAGPQIVGHADDQDSIDETFVRLQKDNWVKYEGSFKNDQKQGQGIVYFKSGRWMGNFKSGQPNGQGVFISSNGHKTKGTWKNGIIIQ